MKSRDWLILLALGAGAYFLYRKVTAIPAALTAIGSDVGNSLYDFFNPNDGSQPVMYLVHFAQGQHYIDSSTVDGSGLFTYNGTQYRIKNDAQGLHYAVTP